MPPDALTLTAAKQAQAVVIQMMAERGRGVVLVGAARLDFALENLLKAVMAPTSDDDERLFTPERSLGSFAAKISLAARLGLIDAAVEKGLHAVRGVRNDFAHSAADPSLDDQRHQKRLARVYQQAQANPLWAAIEPLLMQQQGMKASERN
ncbi:hypothetical protein KBZ20_16865 [Vulcanococcus limneticus Candia 3F8]|uniref:DUF4145 domain-containing protein n=1 Tax=Vulcanococcus limneticus TaxID=2170428 RepID=UPI0018E2F221|nr:DUF4145 domain-containing protein [Vulcanococcus limneticus]MCP9793436.1 hypothetical protein [Vulcanococcus limneticus MW73D5]MCP9895436.1 hypothetical protein [Vulcanococcus limneticus Candia 3F8]MCP9898809.1 hypothetical protein [Vulcanococcus limneticus Candia 3B3]